MKTNSDKMNIWFSTLLFLSLIMGLAIPVQMVRAATPITVCASGCDYTTIQAAIDAAASGDTVNVAAGTYKEQLNITKGLTLIGDIANPDNVIIDGENKTTLPTSGQVRIYNPTGAVIFEGFKIINGGSEPSDGGYYAILTKGDSSRTIQNCKIIGHGSSVDIGSDYGLWAYTGNGELIIKDNYLTAMYHGILLEQQYGAATIQGNTFDALFTGLLSGIKYGGRAIEIINYGTTDVTSLQKISGNQFINFASTGVQISGGFSGQTPRKFTNVLIENNNFDFSITDISNLNGAIHLKNVSGTLNDSPDGGVSATITNNYIHVPSGNGIWIKGSNGSINASNNSIVGNAYGLNATESLGSTINAIHNWWGLASGPGVVGPGTGDKVSTNVDYSPWCGNAACAVFYPPFPLLVTADNQTIIAGQPDPTFAFNYSGFLPGDTSTVIDVEPICSVSVAHNLPSTYPIVCSGGSDTNYTFSYVNGTLTVNAANNPPTDISISSNSVNQQQSIGTMVGSFSSTDPDAGDTFTYSLVAGSGSTDNASFSISNNQLRTAAVFDFATKSSYSIRIRSTDNGSLFFDKVFTITVMNQDPIFIDAPFDNWATNSIERLYSAGITVGCSLTVVSFCPEATVTRAQMAIFILRSMHGSNYTPPSVGTSSGFGDVAVGSFADAWIKELAAAGITSGCGAGNYCPNSTVTRAQMAVFLLKAEHGASFTPSTATGVFSDVTVSYWVSAWVEQLFNEGITSGCGAGNYCPENAVKRSEMAVFLVKTFNLP